MSDRIAVMNAGRIEQIAAPQQLYARPHTPFVAEFVGDINRLHGVIRAVGGERYFVPDDSPSVSLQVPSAIGFEGLATLLVRLETVQVSETAAMPHPERVRAILEDETQLGDRLIFYLRVGEQTMKSVTINATGSAQAPARLGESVFLRWPAESQAFFPGHV